MSQAFFSRWARLKRDRHREAAEEKADGGADTVSAPVPVPPVADLAPADAPARAPARPGPETGSAAREPGLPTPEPELPALESLTPESDFRPFLNRGVPTATRNAALKTLFSDPHFNVMDGLDVYIEDYNQTEPIPDALMRRLAQARTLGLFDEEEPDAERQQDPAATPVPTAASTPSTSSPTPTPTPAPASTPTPTPTPTPTLPDIAAAEPEAGPAPPVDRPGPS